MLPPSLSQSTGFKREQFFVARILEFCREAILAA
jgi:hypothetical protein